MSINKDINSFITSSVATEAGKREIKGRLLDIQKSNLSSESKKAAMSAFNKVRRQTILGIVISVVVIPAIILIVGLGCLLLGDAGMQNLALTLLILSIPTGIIAAILSIIVLYNSKSAKTWRYYYRLAKNGEHDAINK